MNSQITGVVLSITPYQEASAMVYLLTEAYGLKRFVLQGFYKPTSKMQSLGMPFTEVSYRTDYKEDRLLKCYGGELIKSYHHHDKGYEWLVNMSLMAELIIHNAAYCQYEGLYEDVIENLQKDDPIMRLKLVGRIIEGHGHQPYLQGCVVCDDHRIHGFSTSNGGFTCKAHTEKEDSYEYLVMLGQLFNHKQIESTDFTLIQETIIKMVLYLEYHTNIKYHSIDLL